MQVMSAGSGIAHSEMNEEDETTQIFQIWIMPDERACRQAGALSLSKGRAQWLFVTLASGLPGDTDALPIHYQCPFSRGNAKGWLKHRVSNCPWTQSVFSASQWPDRDQRRLLQPVMAWRSVMKPA